MVKAGLGIAGLLIIVFSTVTTTFLLPDLTVIFAVPAFFALITPLELTVATFLLEDE